MRWDVRDKERFKEEGINSINNNKKKGWQNESKKRTPLDLAITGHW